jgi:hypothetical protein
LDFPTGIPLGYGYPLAPDLDGIHSPFLLLLQRNLPALSWQERVRWLQVLGVDAVVLPRDPGHKQLRTVAADRVYGVTTILMEVEDPLPPLIWPRQLEVAESPVEALQLVSRLQDPWVSAVVPQELPHDPTGTVRWVEESPDRLVLEAKGGGGVALVQRSYLPLYRVREPRGAKLIPADLCLLGAVVPPGEQRVEIHIPAWPEVIAGLLALAVSSIALFTWRRS